MMKFKNRLIYLVLIVTLFSVLPGFSQVVLPRLISNGMVLQRNADVKIWGWAAANEKISVQFIDSTYHVTADKNGDWQMVLKNINAGGPYKMIIKSKNSIEINDILVGDVWVCSGQSNMELSMKRVSPIYQQEIASCENSNIRQFIVPQKYDFNKTRNDLSGGNWKSVNLSTIYEFSAVAYFFARELYDKNKIPIGMINTALDGSPAEAWISEDAIKKFPVHFNEAQKFKDSVLIKQIESSDRKRIKDWYDLLWQKDFGYHNLDKIWYNTDLNSSDWTNIKLPGYWLNTRLGAVNGSVWFRKDIHIDKSNAGLAAKLNLGRIVDADSVFVNGIFVGSTSYQYPPRRYEIPAGILKKGKNNITIRVINNSGNGGFVPDKPYELIIGNDVIDLKGLWRFALGTTMEPLASQTFIRWKPIGLYNAMINPLLNYRIKGAIRANPMQAGLRNTKNYFQL